MTVKQRNIRENNLKPFKPGESGNKNGRPKMEFCVPDILRKIGQEVPAGEKATYYELMCRKAWEQAIKGDKYARNFILNRTEGLVKQDTHDMLLGDAEVIVE